MKKLIIALLIFISVPEVRAQLYIEGVITGTDHAAVSYATVGLKGSTRSVMSNEQGYFQMNVSSFPQTIIIGAIGYEIKEVVYHDSQKLAIELTAKSYSLKEVTVKGDEAYRLFLKAYKKLMKPGYACYNGKAFYRLVTQNDETYTELMEGFYNVQANPTGFNYWNLKHGRYAIANDYKQQNYVVSIDLSALARYADITNDHRSGVHFPVFPFSKDAKYHFRFENAGITSIQNKEVSIVRFIPLEHNPDACEGLLYIEESSGKLFRMEARLDKNESNLITTQLGKKNVQKLNVAFTFDFTEHESGVMLLSWVNIVLAYDQSIDANSRRIRTNIQCLVYEKDAPVKKNEKLKTSQTISDYAAIRSRLYIKPFWDENPVIAQTALQKKITADFESKGSFGTAYNDANDTTLFLKEGFALLGNKVNRLIASIQEVSVPQEDPSCIALMLDGQQGASLCSHLFVSYNCYRDSFYFHVLPLIDTAQTWISDTIKNVDSFSAVFKLYARVAGLHAKQLSKAMKELKQPCTKDDEIDAMIAKADDALFQDLSELLQDVWRDSEFYFWERYLEKAEKE